MTTYSSVAHIPGGIDGWRIDLILPRAERYQFAVVDDSGRIWDLCYTERGAVRRRNDHARRYPRATNHHPHGARVVPVNARPILRAYAEANSEGDTAGALASRAALRGARCRERWTGRTETGRTWGGLSRPIEER